MKQNEEYDIDPLDNMKKWLVYSAIAFLFIVLFFSSFYTINAGENGVLLTWGKADVISKEAGLHLKIPLVQGIIKMSTRTTLVEENAQSASKDLQIVHTKVAVNYHLPAENIVKTYVDIGVNYPEKIISPAIQETVKAVTAKYTAEELITRRTDVKLEIDEALHTRLANRGIVVEPSGVSITNFDFSEEFNKAIEQKVTAEQNALAAKNKLEQVKYEAEQKVAEAKGEAERISVIDDTLNKSPKYLQWMALNKWDGQLPKATGGSAIPFINIEAN